MAATNSAGYMHELFEEYNRDIFHGKLSVPIIRVDRRYKRVDGLFQYSWSEKKKKLIVERSMKITIAGHVVDDHPNGTLIHEMIHQYQVEVLGREANHDAIFTSIARRCERLYGVTVR